MNNLIYIILSIVSILMIIFILLQDRGGELGQTFGGSGGFYRSRRGLEKLLFQATIFFSAAFVVISLVNSLLQ